MATREDWMQRLGPLYGGAVALVSSTSWRWPTSLGDTREARSSFWLVAVGAPIGLAGWLVAALLEGIGVPLTICAIAGLAVLSFASATLVERGVVERIDGPDATAPSTTAILVLVFGTLMRVAAVWSLPFKDWLGVFVAAALVGRWAAVFLQALGDPIADEDRSRSLVAIPPPAWLTAALSLGVAAVAVIALGKAGVAAVALAAASAFLLGLDAQRRERGLSPPVVAMTAGIGELLVLLAGTIT